MKADIQRQAEEKVEREWTDVASVAGVKRGWGTCFSPPATQARTREQNEQLIDFYRGNENLWNHKLASYRDRALREVTMKRLGKISPSKSQDEIKKQWHNLKTVFSREIRREESSKVSGSGTDTVHSSQWKLYKQMALVMGSC